MIVIHTVTFMHWQHSAWKKKKTVYSSQERLFGQKHTHAFDMQCYIIGAHSPASCHFYLIHGLVSIKFVSKWKYLAQYIFILYVLQLEYEAAIVQVTILHISAVMACGKMWPNLIIRTRYQLWSHKPLVKWVPDYLQPPYSSDRWVIQWTYLVHILLQAYSHNLNFFFQFPGR